MRFPSGRPAWAAIRALVIGDFREFATRGRDHPYVSVAVEIELLAGAVGYKSDARRVGRPVRVEIVPIVCHR